MDLSVAGRGLEMRSGGRIGGNVPGKAQSLLLAVLMTSGAVLGLAPFIGPTIVAPPTAGTLDVTVHDIAPETHTYPGDENVTMIWLEMTANGGDVQVNSLDFTMGGTYSAGEVSRVVLWNDVSGIVGPDKLQGYYECELARITNPTGSFTLPTVGTLQNCGTPIGNYVVPQSQTRYILVLFSVSPMATEGNTISISLDAMSTDGTVTGDSGASGVVEVIPILFGDEMESGQGGWTTSGNDEIGQYPDSLWHLSSGEENCTSNMFNQRFHHSPVTSWWYGHRVEDPLNPGEFICFYLTSVPGDPLNTTKNWGSLTSPEIDTTGMQRLYLTFWHMLAGEPDTGLLKVDNGHLWLYDGAWHKISRFTDGYDSTDNSWWKETYNLSAYAGTRIQLEFRFDTVDAMNNVWLGWFVDDFTLYGKPGGPIGLRPPPNPNAVLSGPGHEDVRITWELSEDDPGPIFHVSHYGIFRDEVYNPNVIGYALHDTVPNGTSQYIDVGAGEGDPTNHFYFICAFDIVLHYGCNWTQVGKFTRPLATGMNLVSIPLIQWDGSTTTVFQTVEFDEVWTYDSSVEKWTWRVGYKPYLGALSQVDHKMGLWINVTRDSNLTVAGIVPITTTIDLQEGWNLFGFPSFSSNFSVGGLKTLVVVAEIEGYDASAPPYFLKRLADAELMQAGSGYWVRVASGSTWVVSNS